MILVFIMKNLFLENEGDLKDFHNIQLVLDSIIINFFVFIFLTHHIPIILVFVFFKVIQEKKDLFFLFCDTLINNEDNLPNSYANKSILLSITNIHCFKLSFCRQLSLVIDMLIALTKELLFDLRVNINKLKYYKLCLL